MNISSQLVFLVSFLIITMLISFSLVKVTRSREIFWPLWILICYNLGWDAIGFIFGIGAVHQIELRLFAVLVGSVLSIAFLASIPNSIHRLQIKQGRIARFDLWLIATPIFLALLGFVIGIIYQNDITYILSDSYKFLVLSCTFFVCVINVRKNDSIELIFKILIFLIFLQQIIDIATVGIPLLSTGSYTRIADQFWINKLLLFSFLGLMLNRTNSYRERLLFGSILIVTIIATILSFYRTALLLGMSSFFLMTTPRTAPRFIKNLSSIISIAAVVGVILITLLQFSGQTDLFSEAGTFTLNKSSRRFSKISDGGIPPSIEVRLIEAQSIVNELSTRGSPLNWMVGFGSGAQYDAGTKLRVAGGLQRYEDIYGVVEHTHHVHNVFFASLFRYGILGTIILLVFLVRIWTSLRKLDKLTKDNIFHFFSRVVLFYFITTLIVSNLFSSIWGDVNWGILLALSSVLLINAKLIQNRAPQTYSKTPIVLKG